MSVSFAEMLTLWKGGYIVEDCGRYHAELVGEYQWALRADQGVQLDQPTQTLREAWEGARRHRADTGA